MQEENPTKNPLLKFSKYISSKNLTNKGKKYRNSILKFVDYEEEGRYLVNRNLDDLISLVIFLKPI